MRTCTAGTTAPELSVSVPEILPKFVWENEVGVNRLEQINTRRRCAKRRDMVHLFQQLAFKDTSVCQPARQRGNVTRVSNVNRILLISMGRRRCLPRNS